MSSKLRLYVPVYASTLLLSAFLLFLIQPLFGKMILPLLGGAPAVWNTAMVFFQGMLLAGYAYAHATTRFLSTKTQGILHLVLLLIFIVVLPITIPDGWEPPATRNPAWWQLMMMTVVVGGPFFVLSGTAPMLQRWFSHTDHPDAHNPYFLYAASNFGSMSALIVYPVLVEPLMILQSQTMGWAYGYGLLIVLIAACAWMIRNASAADQKSVKSKGPANDNDITPLRIAQWLLLSFVPSSLMLGVTTFITIDLASVPLLWIVPLALYVGTFIIAFARVSPIKLSTVLTWQGLVLCCVLALFASNIVPNKAFAIGLHLIFFFLTALFCHMQLGALRPEARHLTAFYLIMSTGGVLGGIFNALIAPTMLVVPIEYAGVMILASFLRWQVNPEKSLKKFISETKRCFNDSDHGKIFRVCLIPVMLITIAALLYLTESIRWKIIGGSFILIYSIFLIKTRWSLAFTALVILLLYPGYSWNFRNETLAWTRNFFGILRVVNLPEENIRYFAHGTTLHGSQPLEEKYRMMPISYYYKATPAGDIFAHIQTLPGPQNIAVLGLGIGTVACFVREDRHYDFYEIDPDVVTIAEDPALFTYLSDCGSDYDVILGDARLQIEKKPDNHYDVIFADAFSSDNIPIHIITREAIEIYLQKLKPGGFIMLNISNRYLVLEPEVAAIANSLGLYSLFRSTNSGTIEGADIEYNGARFAVLAAKEETLEAFKRLENGWKAMDVPADKKPWTDDYSNIIGALHTFK